MDNSEIFSKRKYEVIGTHEDNEGQIWVRIECSFFLYDWIVTNPKEEWKPIGRFHQANVLLREDLYDKLQMLIALYENNYLK